MTTEQLLARITDGDVTALAALYDRYGRSGYALALRRCGDGERAEQIVRRTFLDLWVDPDRVARPDAAGATLLSRIWTAASRVADRAQPDERA